MTLCIAEQKSLGTTFNLEKLQEAKSFEICAHINQLKDMSSCEFKAPSLTDLIALSILKVILCRIISPD